MGVARIYFRFIHSKITPSALGERGEEGETASSLAESTGEYRVV